MFQRQQHAAKIVFEDALVTASLLHGLGDVGRALFGGVQVERVNMEGIAASHHEIDLEHVHRQILRQAAHTITPCASTLAQGQRDFVVLDLHRQFARGFGRGAGGERFGLRGWRYAGRVLGG